MKLKVILLLATKFHEMVFMGWDSLSQILEIPTRTVIQYVLFRSIPAQNGYEQTGHNPARKPRLITPDSQERPGGLVAQDKTHSVCSAWFGRNTQLSTEDSPYGGINGVPVSIGNGVFA